MGRANHVHCSFGGVVKGKSWTRASTAGANMVNCTVGQSNGLARYLSGNVDKDAVPLFHHERHDYLNTEKDWLPLLACLLYTSDAADE